MKRKIYSVQVSAVVNREISQEAHQNVEEGMKSALEGLLQQEGIIPSKIMQPQSIRIWIGEHNELEKRGEQGLCRSK